MSDLQQLLLFPLAQKVFSILAESSVPGEDEPIFLLNEAFPFIEFLLKLDGHSEQQLAALHVIAQYIGYLKIVQKAEKSAARLRQLLDRLLEIRSDSERAAILKAATDAQKQFATFSGDDSRHRAPKQDEKKPKDGLLLKELHPPVRTFS